VDNVNGRVRIAAWDRPEVQVDVLKQADRREDLEAVKIEIDAKPERIRIHTQYPKAKTGWWHRSNSTRVDYDIKVPAHASLKKIRHVNGSVEIDGVLGTVDASTVNGHLAAKRLAADSRLESVNGGVEATFEKFDEVKSVTIKTVNGGVEIALPTNADADLSAHTVNGGIHTPPNLTVNRSGHRPRQLHARLGNGGTQVRLETVNGGIHVRQQGTASATLVEQPEK
jgi:DUF4097 and DUF4098 domain-containing protein YvlB